MQAPLTWKTAGSWKIPVSLVSLEPCFVPSQLVLWILHSGHTGQCYQHRCPKGTRHWMHVLVISTGSLRKRAPLRTEPQEKLLGPGSDSQRCHLPGRPHSSLRIGALNLPASCAFRSPPICAASRTAAPRGLQSAPAEAPPRGLSTRRPFSERQAKRRDEHFYVAS